MTPLQAQNLPGCMTSVQSVKATEREREREATLTFKRAFLVIICWFRAFVANFTPHPPAFCSNGDSWEDPTDSLLLKGKALGENSLVYLDRT